MLAIFLIQILLSYADQLTHPRTQSSILFPRCVFDARTGEENYVTRNELSTWYEQALDKCDYLTPSCWTRTIPATLSTEQRHNCIKCIRQYIPIPTYNQNRFSRIRKSINELPEYDYEPETAQPEYEYQPEYDAYNTEYDVYNIENQNETDYVGDMSYYDSYDSHDLYDSYDSYEEISNYV